tara:strand:- start:2565 stop:2792 length:228 start_codon:yes stop_codon:yes gene_type:complete
MTYKNFLKKISLQRDTLRIIEVEDEDDITDEIEKSLWEIKERYDLPTEEIDIAIASRACSKQNSGNLIKKFKNSR